MTEPYKGPLKPATLAAQALSSCDPVTGAVVPPIHLATTFKRNPGATPHPHTYRRPDSPTTEQAEAVITALEGGVQTLLFSSGMAAATAFFLALPRRVGAPAHIVAPQVMYWALRHWLSEDASGLGLSVTFVDGGDVGAIQSAVRPGETRAIWLETPANPLWTVSDIAAVAAVARKAGAVLAVDSTAATPVLTRPLALGADVVMHAATKYLNGHSDVLAGSLTFGQQSPLAAAAGHQRRMLGAILSPFEASLLIRGLRTLYVRVERQCATAAFLAEALSMDARILQVLYPGLAAHPGHAIAARQMQGGFGGMLSIRVKAGEAAALQAADRTKLWIRATSLGGVESLLEHRASVEGPGSPCPPDLLRLSCGLEDPQDLLADLQTALGN